MGFRKLRIFPVTGIGNDGYPILGAPVRLVSNDGAAEVVNISIEITKTISERTLEADDRSEISTSVTGYEGTITAYGADATALETALGFTKDLNGNLVEVANKAIPQTCLFFDAENEKGEAYNKWLYLVKFKPLNEKATTKTGTAESITLEFTGSLIELANGDLVTSATVYKGNEGYIASEPTKDDIYKVDA